MKKFLKKLFKFFKKKKGEDTVRTQDPEQTQNNPAEGAPKDAPGDASAPTDSTKVTSGEPQNAPGEPSQSPSQNEAPEAGLTVDELQIKLDAANKKLKQKESIIATISQKLGIEVLDEDAEVVAIMTAIEELQNASTPQVEHAEDVLSLVKGHIINKIKANEYLYRKFREALDERKGKSVAETFIDFINRIKSRVNSEENSGSQEHASLEISEEQIRAGVNTTKLTKFLVDRLKEAGIEVADNLKREDVINVLKRLQEENKAAKEHGDDAEIIRNAFKDGKLPQEMVDELITKAVEDDKLPQDAVKALRAKAIEKILNGNLPEAVDALRAKAIKEIHKGNLPQDVVNALVQLINKSIGENDKHITDCKPLCEVATQIAALSQEASIPNDAKEAAAKAKDDARAEAVKVVKKALAISEVELTEEGIKNALKRYLCDCFSVSGDNLDKVIDAINDHINTSEEAHKLMNDPDVSTLTEGSIRKKVIADELKQLQGVFKDTIVAKASSIEKAIKQLLNKIEESDKATQEVATKLVGLIAQYNSEFKADEETKVLELLQAYSDQVKAKEEQLKNDIRTKDGEINRLNETINARDCDISNLKEQKQQLEQDKSKLLSESDKMVEFARACANNIFQYSGYTLVDDCDASGQSERLQQIVQRALETLLDNVRNVKPAESPEATRAAFRQVFEEDLKKPEGAINVISQYYAYSSLPFMTDSTRSYGVYFNRKNMAQLFDAVNTLLIAFGIRLDIPTLFAQSATDGDYQVVNGEPFAFSELENFCPGARNHLDRIDSGSKPAQIIYDMTHVGYSVVDGDSSSKAKVLTN